MAIFMFVIFTPIVLCSAASEWSYENQGAWPPSCKGEQQSPIAITTTKTTKTCFKGFVFNSATFEKKEATITNTGHTVEIRFRNNTAPPTISGGGLDGTYVLDSFHFHWSAEHTINKYRYPLEGHFVYYSEKYPTSADALMDKNGVTVLAVFYNKVPFFIQNGAFRFVEQVPSVAHKVNQPVSAKEPIVLGKFFPGDCRNFYRYNGSLTTPNCNEVVVWTICQKPSYISSSQYGKLTEIYYEEDKLLESNYRALQMLNGRRVLDSSC